MGWDNKHPKANNKFFRKINRFSFRFIEGKINFHARHNSFYADEDLLKSMIFLSSRNRYPENGCKRYNEIAKFDAPDADTLYRRIKMKGIREILDEFIEIQKGIIEKARKKIRNRRTIVFIDEHEIPWFGKAKLAFRYITINTVVNEQRICLFALPVTPFSSKHKLVDELLKFAKQFFRIGLVLFDRGFSKDSKILRIVEKHGLKYLAPMKKK